MEASFVKDFEQIVKSGVVVDVAGEKFSPVKLFKVVDDRVVAPLTINSLTGLVDYITSNIDQFSSAGPRAIVIDGYKSVRLVGSLNFETSRREIYLQAELLEELCKFPYQQFIQAEDFIIKLKSLFLPNTAQLDLISYVSRLSVDNSIKVEDDGVSQSATVRRGVSGALKSQEQAPAIVTLTPWRTFREVVQPESSFLFRMRMAGDGVPTCALFESDGGTWRITAIENIKNWLSAKLPNLTIIA